MHTKTWFITGASRGLGLEIARAALEAGDQVVATARKTEQTKAGLAGFDDRLLVLPLDVTDEGSIAAAVDAAFKRFGRIDVLVNNAGYGQLGAFEQLSVAAIDRQFATNVFGVFAVTRAVLPVMRAQRSGHVLTVSSVGGLIGFDGASIYCATKFALEGWSESLSLELAQFGIRTIVIEPGYFRTDFLDPSSVSYDDIAIADYADYSARRKAGLDEMNHRQAGDPAKLGKAIVSLAASEDPPVRFAVGSDAYGIVSNRAETNRTEADKWRGLSVSTDISE
ncbi:oxidoreductase [Hyphomicrobium sp.]|uniref:oxidoreductase n=1 Tax=Hyphomicrobium sp. TaxID=82 RepID=UPI0025BFEB41|nr:oxidoreductase [Hyphomicrobium sp.]MCC7254179.1 SDR family NAD(P)-dependent oxidoreductase [Hyphomicrobium sp.]